MELIDRQAAIDELANMYHAAEIWGQEAKDDEIKTRAESCMASIIEMKLRLEKLPATEPKTARWVNVNEGKWNTVEVLKCTACGEIDNRMYRTDGYCPNCGAKMEVNTEK